ncbi:MAG: response regulator transcription factor [Limnohabitans sp.]|jgi:DNA-binding response OmpR family regulator|uniref:response regulator transcription factor n=2 Tax=Limnohabitans sp. TaxID=1907725 RepID=UPI00391CC0E5
MHIALLEDEISLSQEVMDLLSQAGHSVVHFADGHQIMQGLRKDTFDLFVLDWQVTGPSGLDVLNHVRKVLKLTVPVVFLTSHSAEEQIVQALTAGADDYCSKPLRAFEFLARLGALQRRLSLTQPIDHDGELLPGYVFDSINRTVTVRGQLVSLTEKEYLLSRLFFLNVERPIARNRLMKDIWGHEESTLSRTLDVHISWIRRKLDIGANSELVRLVVVHGFGYRLMKIPPNMGASP